MISTVERLSPSKVAIHIEADAQAYEQALQKAYQKQKGYFRIHGFRAGKAPRSVIERYYGADVFAQSAADVLYPDAYAQAVIEHRLTVLDQPNISVEQAKKGEAFLFTVTVTVYPQVTLGDYKSIAVERPSDFVDDDAVAQEIERVRDRNARISEIEDRPAQDDDTVNIDYAGTIDEIPFDGGTADGENLTLGSGKFIPGFEEQLVGMNTGDERDINVKFPDDYGEEGLRGKDAVFHVKLNSISTKELPELDDEFVKDVSEFDTLDAYKASVRKGLEDRAIENADNEWDSRLIAKLVDVMETEIPQIMLEREIDSDIRDYLSNVFRHSPHLIGEYIKKYSDIPGFRNNFRARAEAHLKSLLAMEELAEQENITYDEEADREFFDATAAMAAAQSVSTVDELRSRMERDEQFKLSFIELIKRRKTINLLREISSRNIAEHGVPVEDEAEDIKQAVRSALESAAASEKAEPAAAE